jgi:hypothetical protein
LFPFILVFWGGAIPRFCVPSDFVQSGNRIDKIDHAWQGRVPYEINSARPMDHLADLLQGIYSEVVTYEDPFWMWGADIGPCNDWIGLYPIDRTFALPFELNSSGVPEFGTAFIEIFISSYNQQADGPHFEA